MHVQAKAKACRPRRCVGRLEREHSAARARFPRAFLPTCRFSSCVSARSSPGQSVAGASRRRAAPGSRSTGVAASGAVRAAGNLGGPTGAARRQASPELQFCFRQGKLCVMQSLIARQKPNLPSAFTTAAGTGQFNSTLPAGRAQPNHSVKPTCLRPAAYLKR